MPVTPRPGDPAITPELVAEHGISEYEYKLILDILGREPSYTELGVFSAMWSEHCGYKNSRPLLRKLPTTAPWVLQGPGENAGVIDVGDGLAVAFKIESHNHPSAVEPYQGAATGVGGILRDVFTMGARPIAVLNSLRFGEIDGAEGDRVRYLVGGVVKGIGDYGNCVGIPTVGGEVYFDAAYEGNPLVNAMAIGLMKTDELIRGVASGVGNPIMAVGSKTGRDGIHGATFASAELSEESEAKRPMVQVGDPFTEKLLLEASLELIRSGHIVGIQDMGAAGLVSSSTEMAARGGTGVDIEITTVPVRERGMTPYEILLSETQERMLVVAHEGREEDVRAILGRWDLDAEVIGHVTDTGRYVIRENGVVVVDIPGEPLVDACPTYTREGVESAEIAALRAEDVRAIAPRAEEADPTWTLRALLDSPTIASKRWVYEQYDSTVRTNTVVGPGSDAAVLRLRGTNRGIAATVDCNSRYVYLNPHRGGQIAVAEAARNLACSGALPRAVTDNLNFGNPLKPEVYYQLSESLRGIGEACTAFQTPITGGNVSLYNENPLGAIYPTPTIGMVGVIDNIDHVMTAPFRGEGDAIVLLGANTDELGGSEYLKVVHGRVAGDAPAVSLDGENALRTAVLALIAGDMIRSAHDTAEGGLAVALAECAIANPAAPLGMDVELDDELPGNALLFGEAQGRVVVSCAADGVDAVLALAAEHGVPAKRIGTVGAPFGTFAIRTAAGTVEAAAGELAEIYERAIPRRMDGTPADVETSLESMVQNGME
ncbi:phosphoribosylformylglycinamidine synthase subunit PurL [Longimicrobium terrae]|uniref:Phosphoribosylformylglycinamidine synthase subunit PurL n=1 Tax=Longimicrobium terrae TaxID=1639882 RepID=A0A841GWB4_9BACT|nr:phosphoribosylformylglycinamidine synthase [Longimicrobium terrae]MBB6069903.1 phosphoribosylformylglycinamidine synthase [Longimicrobium terrae]NNC32816.1 phosphoribosylformylglycinamidine synthase subunit PurL [Longimicrobium terrae]